MPSIETSIWLALKERILTAPGGLRIAWPAEEYFPTSGVAYLAVNNIIDKPARLTVGPGPHSRTGTLMLGLAYPLGQAMEASQEVAGQIAAHFPEDLCMTNSSVNVRIASRSHVREGYRDGSWWRVPINIFWRALA